ncbi:hypothetical protein VKI21_09615 [Cyanobacterium aponinum UTEX 3222]|uniref:hypothetical protein n=1 Tax=Cyanobacterium aponinum TaxID=379064 RepID=UPI002B4C1906|nr:hypothetical protein [Cyanobacterium aponinum]WRL39384.1 hypothetical protein VKI22_04590 [Cyanobacterium aponinum UTEX 3221]WRL43920.1 hypothetical protein VKI21_09615 [Cyanobacterium aponinum UTEX 3222]
MSIKGLINQKIENLSESEQMKVLNLIDIVQQENLKTENQLWSQFSLEQAMKGLENDLIPEYTEADLIEKWQ